MTASPNRLADEQSPYLRQHAYNPVDWYPWCDEALERARREDKPILLSIGYSACHWCHVMERESFENEAIAALMNDGFINIKVDREERPDLDAIYMNTVQMLTGSGGWPLTVFLGPDGRPFYGGTYFPPEDRYGRPGFPRVLSAVVEAFRNKREELLRTTTQLTDGLARLSRFEARPGALQVATVLGAAEKLFAARDTTHGGLGDAPKFPNAPAFALWLRHYHRSGRAEFREAFEQTLDGMAGGGMYDQLGGGFHRYSVDAQWLVPHFEKMLYDNALLVPLYLDGYRATGRDSHARIARETLDYLLGEMRHPDGGFYATQDADTDGEEGLTYLWRLEEMEKLLGEEQAALLSRYYEVDAVGNFAEAGQTERKSVLHVKLSVEELAANFGLETGETRRRLEEGRKVLLAARRARPQPGRDDKVLTSWNGLAIRAFVRGALVLGRSDYLEAAMAAAGFVDRHLCDEHGRLLRTFKDGVARYSAYLDDHAFLAAAHLDLFEATGRREHAERARSLASTLLEDFFDPTSGGFFFTARDHEKLIDRPKIAFDSSVPAGNAVATEVFLRLGHLFEDEHLTHVGEQTLTLFGTLLEEQPFGLATLLGILDDHLRGPRDVVIVGDREDPRTVQLLRAAHGTYAPGTTVFCVEPGDDQELLPAPARGKTSTDAQPLAYVCQAFTCSPPVAEPQELRDLIQGGAGEG
jgi:uncharacterized protein YyaL (SSP411 family)